MSFHQTYGPHSAGAGADPAYKGLLTVSGALVARHLVFDIIFVGPAERRGCQDALRRRCD
jgi:hypothetical protein